MGDNHDFEENMSAERLINFEDWDPDESDLRRAAADYFLGSVQGALRSHVPSTFQAMNSPAIRPRVEGQQRMLRLERIDSLLGSLPHEISLAALTAATNANTRDLAVLSPLIRGLNGFSGARPAFACFKSEVWPDIKDSPRWLELLIQRLGLGHWKLADGETGIFVLMEYMAQDVLAEAGRGAGFAVPTVLESQNSPYFFPPPQGSSEGYAIDLDHSASRASISEILHVRLTYRVEQLVRIGQLVGPTSDIELAAARNSHLARLRARCTRPDFGQMMPSMEGVV